MTEESKRNVQIPMVGVLAVKNLLITREELQAALNACKDAKNLEAAVSAYFVSNEMISTQNIERLTRAAKALDLRQKELKFGALAIRKGLINQSVLKLALEEQEQLLRKDKKVRLIGDLLVEAGMLTEQQRDEILKFQKRYRLETAGGKTVTPDGPAGQEGTDPKTAEEEPEPEAGGLMEPETIDGGIRLEVSKDFMAAFLTKTQEFDSNTTVAGIKEALFDRGIINGIVADEMIDGFIKSSGFKTKSFRVAKGILPVQGKDAKVEFFFNTQYLKAGGVSENGAIDFKDRGDIPFVEDGTVLAEKIPMVESRTGQTIYGDEIEAIPGKDIVIKIGKGARFSEDGHKVIAAVKGFPKYTLSGYVFVHQEYITEGDVDYETGHVSYDGNVNIKGRIKSGFKVKANDVTAIEVDGGIVTADGDVTVAGGINDGRIYARGNVYARFVHKSEIVCMGSVVVEKEIVDSTVETSGSCMVQAGKLISSKVTAKMGIQAKNVGSDMSGPNVLKVGHDVFTEKELEKNTRNSDALLKQIEEIAMRKNKLKEENAAVQKLITDLAHLQDRSQLDEKELESKLADLGSSPENQQAIDALNADIQKLKQTAQKAESQLDDCFDKADQIESVVEKHDREIQKLEEQRANLTQERSNLIQWSKENPGKPVVIVEGAILAETQIIGKHSEKRITDIVRRSKISEVLCSSDEAKGLGIYEIRIGTF